MELLQFLLSFFLSQYGGKDFEPIIAALKDGSFDLSKALSSVTPQMIMPLIQSFLSKNKQPQPTDCGEGCNLKPIADIADREIIYSLNRYFSS